MITKIKRTGSNDNPGDKHPAGRLHPLRGLLVHALCQWQGSLANLNAVQLAAVCGKQALAARRVPLEAIDLAILGITNPQKGGFYGLPWLTGMMGLDRVAGPTIQQACATSVRALQMASHEVRDGSSQCTCS